MKGNINYRNRSSKIELVYRRHSIIEISDNYVCLIYYWSINL